MWCSHVSCHQQISARANCASREQRYAEFTETLSERFALELVAKLVHRAFYQAGGKQSNALVCFPEIIVAFEQASRCAVCIRVAARVRCLERARVWAWNVGAARVTKPRLGVDFTVMNICEQGTGIRDGLDKFCVWTCNTRGLREFNDAVTEYSIKRANGLCLIRFMNNYAENIPTNRNMHRMQMFPIYLTYFT